MTAKPQLPRTSSPMHYFAKAEGVPEQILCVRLVATPTGRWGLGAEDSSLGVLVTAAGGGALPPGPQGRVIPYLRASYIAQQHELHIEDIEAGILVRGQRFLQNTLRQCLELFPEARSTMLANVLHEPTRSLMLKHLDSMADAPFAVGEASGPLARGLAAAGFEDIEVVPEGGRRTYIGLRGRRLATAATLRLQPRGTGPGTARPPQP